MTRRQRERHVCTRGKVVTTAQCCADAAGQASPPMKRAQEQPQEGARRAQKAAFKAGPGPCEGVRGSPHSSGCTRAVGTPPSQDTGPP